MSFKPGDTIIRKGDVGDAFYIVKAGKVVCSGAGTASKVCKFVVLRTLLCLLFLKFCYVIVFSGNGG